MVRADFCAPAHRPHLVSAAGPGHIRRPGDAANRPRFGAPAPVESPLDAWWHVQDLLWRLHARQAIEVLPLGAAHVVRLRHAFNHPESAEAQALLDPRVDAWRDGATARQLIVHRDFAPEGLCLHFASAARIAHWPEGPALLDQMTAFFNLLSRNKHDQQRATA